MPVSAKVLKFQGEAREKVRAGLNILANAIKVTVGPKGRLVMLEFRTANGDQFRRHQEIGCNT